MALPDLGVSTSQDRFVALAEFRFRPDRVVGLRRDPARLGRRVLLERAAYRLLTDRKIVHVGWARGSAGGAGWVWLPGGWAVSYAAWVRVTV